MCEHIECGNTEKLWLPYFQSGHLKGLKPHPYCLKCGMVKNIGPDKANGTGYYINILSFMLKKLKLPGSNVRMRLVVKELEKCKDFDDSFSMKKCDQKREFTKIVRKFYNIPENVIQSFF